MAKLLCITDIHSAAEVLENILQAAGTADGLLLGGDITHFGQADEAERLVRRAQAFHTNVFAVSGNCDSAEIERRLEQLGVTVHGQGRILGELGIHGLSGAPPWQPRMYEFNEQQLAQALESGFRATDAASRRVVLAHVPPRGCKLDRTFLLQHVGSTALREHIEQCQPEVVVCGHIHEARGIERLGQTTVVNCGAATRGYYAVVELDHQVRATLHRV